MLLFPLISCATVHTVDNGQSLMTISHQYYGTHQCWHLIFESNPTLITPDQIELGQKLKIPKKELCAESQPWIRKLGNNQQRKQINSRSNSKIKPYQEKFVMFDQEHRKVKKLPVNRGPVPKHLQPKATIDTIPYRVIYSIQLAAFPMQKQAQILHSKLQVAKIDSRIEPVILNNNQQWWRVRVGYFLNKKQARIYSKKVKLPLFSKDNFIAKLGKEEAGLAARVLWERDKARQMEKIEALEAKTPQKFQDIFSD